MRGTRSSKAAAADTTKKPPTTKSKYCLASTKQQTSKLFVLPREAAAEAKIVALPHPRSGQLSRYLVCPDTGFYEFTKIAAPKATPRSWLITSSSPRDVIQSSVNSAETITSSDLFIATYYDPLFLLLPALIDTKASKSDVDQKRLFLSSDDYFDKLVQDSNHFSEIVRWPKTKTLLESRMTAICDTVDAGDEVMFRINEEKLFSIIFSKAHRLSNGGLPTSIEEKFVKKALEAPIMLRSTSKLHGAAAATVAEDNESDKSTPKTESTESQSSLATKGSTFSAVSQPLTTASSSPEEVAAEDMVVSAITASDQVVQLQRLRVAFDFICANCISQDIAERLKQQISTALCPTDFAPLNAFTAQLERLRKEAVATRSVDNFSKRRMRDEEEDEARMEKKRKMEQDKKRKANESRGVKNLKKVNTSGMKKLSAFFAKK